MLTTRAECDEALDSLAAELDSYQQRDSNLDFQGRQADRSAADVAGRLAGVNAEIASYTATLAQADLPASLRKQMESKLRKANDRKDNLAERGQARSGSAAFLASVDAEQNAAQVTVLTDAQAQVAARKAALPA
ncbi:hypothetical protein B0919_16370 [Hymenobacter sp. CRA2]|nr:hypothetical protein B0919_16370 [Hymenobacter sp. CRA2]